LQRLGDKRFVTASFCNGWEASKQNRAAANYKARRDFLKTGKVLSCSQNRGTPICTERRDFEQTGRVFLLSQAKKSFCFLEKCLSSFKF
jgi:hypothetical protein